MWRRLRKNYMLEMAVTPPPFFLTGFHLDRCQNVRLAPAGHFRGARDARSMATDLARVALPFARVAFTSGSRGWVANPLVGSSRGGVAVFT